METTQQSLTGTQNTAIGRESGCDLTSGSNNIFVGNQAGANVANTIGAVTTGSNKIIIGNNDHTDALVKVAWTVTSDERDKMNFESISHGLDFVTKLNPISYNFKKSRENPVPHGQKRYGFKAQDILKLEGDNPIIIDNENPDMLKYKGEHLVPILVNAIKDLKKEIDELKNK